MSNEVWRRLNFIKTEVILVTILSYRDIEELLRMRGVKVDHNGLPSLINIDKSGANQAGIKIYNKRNGPKMECRSCKYLNNIVEEDHRFIKKRIGLMLGFKSFESAKRTLAGIELVRMLKKGQLIDPKSTAFKSFCSLAA